MRYRHHPTHWIGVALVVLLALMAFEAWGRPAVREMRPGAQAVTPVQPQAGSAGRWCAANTRS